MEENREGTLADFQACTGIDDVGEAILHLEEAEWDLVRAVNRVMPQESQTLPSEMDVDVEMIGEVKATSSRPNILSHNLPNVPNMRSDSAMPFQVLPASDLIGIAGTSHGRSSRARDILLTFNFNNAMYPMAVSDSTTIEELKNLVAVLVNTPSCQFEIQGWPCIPRNDRVTLASMNLPRDITLKLVTPDILIDDEMSAEELQLSERLAQQYTLSIFDKFNQKTYNLKLVGSTTVLDVKTNFFALSDIPVRHQLWTGWPQHLRSDKTTIARAGLNFPIHELSVEKNLAKDSRKILVDIADSDSSVEEFEDASETFTVEDDIFVDVETKRIQPLIPDNIDDEASGCIHFSEEFTSRYGVMRPDFFLGTLDEAIREACTRTAKDRRLLAVYLHHDSSVLTNVFCTQLLCFESVLQCLASHFVVWGWDLTHEANRGRFLASVARSLGGVAAMTIRNIDVEQLPAVLIIMKIRSTTEIFTVVHGNVGVSELLTSLIQSVDVFSEQQRLEIREEEERSARELVKREQDEAYEESLETDRAKEEAKKHQTMMANKERERRESHKQEMESLREAHRLEVEASLPDEPEEGASGDGISKIRVRLPTGEFINRRFHATTPLQVLLNFLIVAGYPSDEYKVISSWPRRDLTSLDPNQTLQELKLYPQETVILEER